MFGKRSAPKWAVIGALVLLLATTALAAAQSPDLHLPLITDAGEAAPEAREDEQVEEAEPPLLAQPVPEVEVAPELIEGETADAPAAVNAFNATN